MYEQTENYKVTRETAISDFLNATTPYGRYIVFMRILTWLDAKDELAHIKEVEINNLRSQVSAYAGKNNTSQLYEVAK